MRFGDGAWSMLPGVVPHYLSRVDGVEIREREVVIHVASRPEKARWATLYGHMFTVRITSPADNVARIEVTHHKGRQRRGPRYELGATAQPLGVTESADRVSLTAGQLKVVVTKDPWNLAFVDAESGEPITQSPYQGDGAHGKGGAWPVHARAADARRGRTGVRSGRALCRSDAQRPERRHVELRLRHLFRQGLQERAVLLDQPGATACWSIRRRESPSRSAPSR